VRVFFIISTLPFRRTAGADDPNGSRALGKTDQQELVLGRVADDNFPLFRIRVDVINENRRALFPGAMATRIVPECERNRKRC
jgi:hypothetical protein